MPVQYATLLKNALLDAYESHIGVSPVLRLRTGAKPAAITDASTGTIVAAVTCPSDWMSAASAASKALLGTWQDLTADNAGVVGHYELYASDGTTLKERGDVTATGGGGDLTLDNTNVTAGQAVTITAWTKTA